MARVQVPRKRPRSSHSWSRCIRRDNRQRETPRARARPVPRQAERLHLLHRPLYEFGCSSRLAIVVRSSRGRCIPLSGRAVLCEGLESPSDCSQTPISSLAARRLLCWTRGSLDRNLLTAGSVGRCVAHCSYGAASAAGGRCTSFTFVGCSGAPAP